MFAIGSRKAMLVEGLEHWHVMVLTGGVVGEDLHERAVELEGLEERVGVQELRDELDLRRLELHAVGAQPLVLATTQVAQAEQLRHGELR